MAQTATEIAPPSRLTRRVERKDGASYVVNEVIRYFHVDGLAGVSGDGDDINWFLTALGGSGVPLLGAVLPGSVSTGLTAETVAGIMPVNGTPIRLRRYELAPRQGDSMHALLACFYDDDVLSGPYHPGFLPRNDIAWTTQTWTRQTKFDRDGNALFVYQPGKTVGTLVDDTKLLASVPQVLVQKIGTIRLILNAVDAEDALAYSGKINSDTFLGFDAGMLMAFVTATPIVYKIESTTPYSSSDGTSTVSLAKRPIWFAVQVRVISAGPQPIVNTVLGRPETSKKGYETLAYFTDKNSGAVPGYSDGGGGGTPPRITNALSGPDRQGNRTDRQDLPRGPFLAPAHLLLRETA